MRILLDECVPVQIRNALPAHEVKTARQMGWGGLANRQTPRRNRTGWIRFDHRRRQNPRHQQNLAGRKLAILELWTNHRPTLEQHFNYIRSAVERIKPGHYVVLPAA